MYLTQPYPTSWRDPSTHTLAKLNFWLTQPSLCNPILTTPRDSFPKYTIQLVLRRDQLLPRFLSKVLMPPNLKFLFQIELYNDDRSQCFDLYLTLLKSGSKCLVLPNQNEPKPSPNMAKSGQIIFWHPQEDRSTHVFIINLMRTFLLFDGDCIMWRCSYFCAWYGLGMWQG